MLIWCQPAGFKSAEPSAVPVMSGSTSAGRLRTTIQRHKNLPLPILILASSFQWWWMVVEWWFSRNTRYSMAFDRRVHNYLAVYLWVPLSLHFQVQLLETTRRKRKQRPAPSNQVFEFQSLKSTHGCVCHSHLSHHKWSAHLVWKEQYA